MAGPGRPRRAARDRRWRFSPPPQFASRALPRAATAHLRSLVDPQDHRAPWTRSGDGLLAELSSVADALRCALASRDWKPAAASDVTANELGTPDRLIFSPVAPFIWGLRAPVPLHHRATPASNDTSDHRS